MGCKVDTNIMEYEVAHIIKSCTNNVQYPDGVVYTMLNNVFFLKKKATVTLLSHPTSKIKNVNLFCVSQFVFIWVELHYSQTEDGNSLEFLAAMIFPKQITQFQRENKRAP